ncbi:MAG: carboxypeptidase-like regulatory domain-containing protein, partial [Flammeovirgaceae bacterium]
MKNLSLLILLLISTSSYAQTITGTVKTEAGDGISFVNVSVLNSLKGAVADNEGNFTLLLEKGKYQLMFSAVGYASKISEVEVIGEEIKLDIVLSENTQTLSELVVTANKREEDIVNVSTSITSLSAKKMEDTRTWGLGGLTALVPNYTYQELGVPFQ